MVVGCPKCKAKLKVPDEKIKPEGTKFKCPKCRAMLLVKKPVKRVAPTPPPPPEPEVPPETPAPSEAPAPEMPAPQMEAPAPEAPPPPSEEPEATSKMEPATESPAPPGAPPEEKLEEKAPPAGAPTVEMPPETRRVLLAHPDPQTVNMLKFVLMGANFTVISAPDGVEAMVRALKEHPAVVVADVRLPKIHGIEVMKRLKSRAETKDIRIILTGDKPEPEVPRIRGAAGYIHRDRMQQGLVELINKALAEPTAPPEEAPAAAKPAEGAPPKPAAPPADVGVQRAQRLARTVLSDIDLYNKDKVEQAIRQGNFESVFASELKEGLKLYEMRIPADVRSQGNFYEEAVQAFIEKKKQQFGI